MMIFNSILFGCFFCLLPGVECGWSYEDPSKWHEEFPKCRGKRQSPINIVKSETQYSESLVNSLSFFNYEMAVRGEYLIKNDGHLFQVDTPSVPASITLKEIGVFNLAQFHFHWGSDEGKGSEHLINGKHYPAELHLVHYNNKYSSLKEAVNKSDGLAVLGIMIEKGEENPTFKNFLDLTKYNVTHEGTNSSVKAFPVADLLPTKTFAFHRYQGSLTTPTCDESVTWTVFDHPIQISEKQFADFRRLEGHGLGLMNNFRPVQNLNGRQVFTTIKPACASGNFVKASIFSISIFIFLSLAFL